MAAPSTPTKRPYGPKIVRAWFDTVLSALTEGARWEERKMAKAEWEWSFLPARVGAAFPAHKHLDHKAIRNLRLLIELHPEIGRLVDAHDQAVEQLHQACASLQECLEGSELLTEALRKLRAAEGEDRFERYFGAYRPHQYPSVVGELIVNGKKTLPSYFATAPLWNRHGQSLLQLAESAECGARKEQLRVASEELRARARALADGLEELQTRLALEFDVPPYDPSTKQSPAPALGSSNS